MRLDKARRFGFNGPEALSIVDIAALADAYQMTGEDQRFSFIDRIQLMDGAYLAEYYRVRSLTKPKGK